MELLSRKRKVHKGGPPRTVATNSCTKRSFNTALINKKIYLFGAPKITLDKLCRICLEILLADDFYEESGICFGPNHQHSTTSTSSNQILENPIQAEISSVTSRNQIVEEAYRARNQIKSNSIPADDLKSPNEI